MGFCTETRTPHMDFALKFALDTSILSRGIERDKLNGTNRAEFAVFRRFSLNFAAFRFSWELQHFGGADFRRKPQETADFRRNPFVPFSLSLLIPPYSHCSSLRQFQRERAV